MSVSFTNASATKSPWGPNGRIAIFALLVIHMVLPLIVGTKTISYDGAQYLEYAENLLQTHEYTFDGIHPSCGRAPGYPVFLAIFVYLFGSINPAYPVQVVMLFAAYISVALTFKSLLPGSWRLAPVAFLVACWPLNKLGITIQTEALFIFLSSLGLLFLSRFLCWRKASDLIFFSVLSTLSAYVRPVTMLFVFFTAGVLLVSRHMRSGQAVMIIALSAALLAPWTYRNWQVFGRFVPLASNYGSIYYMTDQTAFESIMLGTASASHQLPLYREIVQDDFELDLAANQRYLERAKENISRDPLGFVKRCILKTIFVWSYLPTTRLFFRENRPLFFAGVLVQLSFLGTAIFGAMLLRRRNPWIVWPGGLFAVYHVLALFPFYAESRFLVPVYVILSGFSMYTASYLAKRFYNRARQRTISHSP